MPDQIEQLTALALRRARLADMIENALLGAILSCLLVGAGFLAGFYTGIQEPRDLTIGEKICANYDAKHGYGVKK